MKHFVSSDLFRLIGPTLGYLLGAKENFHKSIKELVLLQNYFNIFFTNHLGTNSSSSINKKMKARYRSLK